MVSAEISRSRGRVSRHRDIWSHVVLQVWKHRTTRNMSSKALAAELDKSKNLFSEVATAVLSVCESIGETARS